MTALERLQEAATLAAGLGLKEQAATAQRLVTEIERRLGFPGGVYVLALAGGTGVGKSSVLNALAGADVSPARALRPTTEHPLAWVAAEAQPEVGPLLQWLGVERVVGHSQPGWEAVAILDLPDFDSVRVQHRAAVDALLPRIDAVAWVVDPEKYDDERLHEYLRRLAPHASRMRFIFNKADRLEPHDRRLLVDDFRRRLRGAGIDAPVIDLISARDGTGVGELRETLRGEADAKSIVASKLATDARLAVAAIGEAAGLPPGGTYRPLLAPGEVAAATETAVAGALDLVDPPGVSRQMEEAVLHQARRQGGSLLARIIALLATVTGRRQRQADPRAYLLDWRRRGTLGHVLNPVRAALVRAAAMVPAATRPALLARLESGGMEDVITRSLDRSTREAAGGLEVPRSLVWTLLGFLQLLTGAIWLLAIGWYLTIILGPEGLEVATFDLPLLGPVPVPLGLVAGGIVVSLVWTLILTVHAGWIGRRQGRRVARLVKDRTTEAISEAGFGGLSRVEERRRTLAQLVASDGAPHRPGVTG
jgi:GTP-binding protein EngB required for normal cell division